METTAPFSASYPLSILVADPNPEAHRITRNLLCQLGYQPEMASSHQEIVKKTSIKSYDVILVDIQMLEVEGIPPVSCSNVRHRPLFISMTGNTRLNFKQVCLQVEMDHSITKPVDLKELSLQLKACSLLTGNCRVI